MTTVTRIDAISANANMSDEASVKAALKEMRDVPDHELHFHLVRRDMLQQTSPSTRQAVTFAQIEHDRRVAAQRRCLAILTTVVSGAIGLVGVVVGAMLKSG